MDDIVGGMLSCKGRRSELEILETHTLTGMARSKTGESRGLQSIPELLPAPPATLPRLPYLTQAGVDLPLGDSDRKSTRLNSSHT